MHTPGPWLIEGGDFVYALNNMGVNIFSCHIQGGFTNDGKRTSQAERSAIASLIAAAPEMLDLLKAILQTKNSSDWHYDRLVSLIAKAEGKP